MKKFFFLIGIGLLTGCTAEPLENYESNNQPQFTEVPNFDGIYLEEIDKDKVRRPGSQGGN